MPGFATPSRRLRFGLPGRQLRHWIHGVEPVHLLGHGHCSHLARAIGDDDEYDTNILYSYIYNYIYSNNEQTVSYQYEPWPTCETNHFSGLCGRDFRIQKRADQTLMVMVFGPSEPTFLTTTRKSLLKRRYAPKLSKSTRLSVIVLRIMCLRWEAPEF